MPIFFGFVDYFAYNAHTYRVKKVLGLSLGSGGAKGVAHIGALAAFSEAGVKFDIVGGTSIGSVMAALYALGYTPREMLMIIKETGFCKTSTFLDFKFRKKSLKKFLDYAIGDRTFNDLKIPYFCVAADLYSGEQVVLTEGDLNSALAASCAIPPIFSAVEIGGRFLVDGAFLNSVPADVLKQNGADKVVAIDLSADKPMNYGGLKTLNKLFPGNKIVRGFRSLGGYKYADVMLAPDLERYGIMNLSRSDELYDIGYETVIKNLDFIKEKLSL